MCTLFSGIRLKVYEMYIFPEDCELNFLSPVPRPSVCCSAITTLPDGDPTRVKRKTMQV